MQLDMISSCTSAANSPVCVRLMASLRIGSAGRKSMSDWSFQSTLAYQRCTNS